MILDRYAEQLEKLERKFYDYKKDLPFLIKKIYHEIDHTLISKGDMINITPFWQERLGERLNGKVIPSPIFSNDCIKYHYDKKDRLVMKERYDTFLQKFLIEELFIYKDDLVERLRVGSGSDLQRLFVFDHGFVNTQLCLSFGDLPGTGRIAEEYVYGKVGLEEINKGRNNGDYKETFIYDKGKLIMIETTWPGGVKRLTYTAKRPNFQKIRQETYRQMRTAIEHFPEGYSALGIEGFLDQSEPMLCLCVTDELSPSDLIADWKTDMTDVRVYDWQLDDQQLGRCVKMVAEVLVELVHDGVINEKQIYFHQNQVPVTATYPRVRSVFRNAGFIVK